MLQAETTMLVTLQWLGQISYAEGLKSQRDFIVGNKTQEVLLLGMEHPATITLGRNPIGQTDILEPTLAQKKFSVVQAERGGRATVHAPGQLVLYPLVHLPSLGISLRQWVRFLELVTESIAIKYGKTLVSHCDPGVYTNLGKIAFLGLRIEKGFSTHGLGINVHDMQSYFQAINPCGVAGQRLDFLSDSLDTKTVFQEWCFEFQKQFTELKSHSKPLADNCPKS